MKLEKYLSLLSAKIYLLSKYSLFITMIIIVIVISLNVICRFFFNFSLPWAEEICRYCLVWGTFLGACCGYKTHELIGMTLLIRNLPQMIRWKIGLLVEISIAILLVLALSFGCIYVKNSVNQLSPALQIPMAYIFISIPISSLFMLIFNIENIFTYFREKEFISSEFIGKNIP